MKKLIFTLVSLSLMLIFVQSAFCQWTIKTVTDPNGGAPTAGTTRINSSDPFDVTVTAGPSGYIPDGNYCIIWVHVDNVMVAGPVYLNSEESVYLGDYIGCLDWELTVYSPPDQPEDVSATLTTDDSFTICDLPW